MPFTREEAFAALASLTPAPVFLEAYRTRRLPLQLDIYFAPPEEFFIAPDTQERYTGNRFIPILDDGNFQRVLFLEPVTRELIQLYVEFPEDSGRVFAGWEEYLADLMAGMAGSIDDESQLRRIAELTRYEHIDELIARRSR